MSEPSRLPYWATSGTALIADPGEPKQAEGWKADEIPTAETFNFWKNLVGQWIEHLKGQVSAVAAQKLAYDAIVGAGGTHNTLEEALAATSNGARILIASSIDVTAPIIIDGKIDVAIEVKPGRSFITTSAAAKALEIKNSNRIRIIGGRFTGFPIAIDIFDTSKNTVVEQNYFFNNSNDVQDNGVNTTLGNNYNEVA